ncbi:MAG: PAS domain S-box protein [Acidobacteria bacterium]|jgi:PAS domain S-box-containing protein|nr:PAS domain S-box protein [Acidobacteriota bacterium]
MKGKNGTDSDGHEVKRYRGIIPSLLIIFLSTFLWPPNISAQNTENIEFDHISIEQGLSQSTVFCIIQDCRGFMWFGTQNGLNRYDGNTFKVYVHNPKNPESLSLDLVISIYEDKSGLIWIGTLGGGLNRFDPKTEKFSHFKNNNTDSHSLSSNTVWTIAEDHTGNLWIGTDKGVNKFDRKEGKFNHYLKGEQINTIHIGNLGFILVGTDKGLYYYESDSNIFKEIKCNNKNNTNSIPQKMKVIYEDADRVLWVGTDQGVYKFIWEKDRWKAADSLDVLKDMQISALFKDSSGRLWIGTPKKGLFIYDLQGKKTIPLECKSGVPYSLSHNEIKAIYEDNSGLVWIGTNGGGINIFDPNRKKFTLYRNISGDLSSLSYNDIMALCIGKDGNAWMGTWGKGIDRFDTEEKKFYHYDIPSSVSRDPNRNNIRAICEDYSGMIWIGSDSSGVFTFNPREKAEEKRFAAFKCECIGEEEHILCIYVDIQNQVWIGTMNNGLVRIAENRSDTRHFKNIPGNPNSLSDNAVYSVFQDREGILWVGTRGGGLNRLAIDQEQFFCYMPQIDDSNSLSHSFITSIYQDKAGTLWIGTNGGGLNKFDSLNETFTAYTTQHGLPDNTINATLEDEYGYLWISTNKGLSRFDLKKTFRNYTIRDGLQGYEFNGRVACKTKSGMMLFGGINGLNEFDPRIIGKKDKIEPPTIVITAFKKLGKKNQIIVDTSIPWKTQLELSYEDDFISFEFAALSFADPGQNRYAYKLEPLNKNWIPLGNKHDIDFLNLAPGDYTLCIKGSNNDGIWNTTGTSIKIKVNPPFWLTWWFIALSAMILGSFTIYLVKRRIQNIEEKRKQLAASNTLLKKEISVRQQTEEKLKESEDLYRTLVETSPDAIALCDINGKIIMTNQKTCSLLGYSDKEMREEVISIFKLLKWAERAKARIYAEKAIKRGTSRNIEFVLRTKDGTGIPVEVSTSLIKDGEGKPKYFLEMARDIRDRKEAEQQEKLQQEKLIQVDKMVTLGRLVSGVAHELNNPASSIKMNSEIFDRVWSDVAPVLEEYYKKNNNFTMAGIPYIDAKSRLEDLIIGSMESAHRIEKIIKDLRDFSRPGDATTQESIDINKVIQSSVNLTHNLLTKTTKHFSLKLAENLPFIMGNSTKLEQVFINLIQNACQALPDNTAGISISTSSNKERKQVVIQIKDEGVGIGEKDLKFITDPFFTTKRDRGGTGLGLSISMQIIQEHGGTMNFESQVGKGTTVIVSLPTNYGVKE